MSLFRKIFRGSASGGSGGPTTADKVSMTPVPGVNATNVQAGMSVIGEQLDKIQAKDIVFNTIPHPERTDEVWGALLNLGQLSDGRYAIFTKNRLKMYDGMSGEEKDYVENAFVIMFDVVEGEFKNILYCPKTDLVSGISQNSFATNDVSASPSYHKKDENGDLIIYCNQDYRYMAAWDGSNQIDAFISDIIKLSDNTKIPIKSITWVQGQDTTGLIPFCGSSPYFIIPHQPYSSADGMSFWVNNNTKHVVFSFLSIYPGDLPISGQYNQFPRVVKIVFGPSNPLYDPNNLLEITVISYRNSVKIIKHTATGVFTNASFSIYKQEVNPYQLFVAISNISFTDAEEYAGSYSMFGTNYDRIYSVDCVSEIPDYYTKISDISPSPDLMSLAPFINADASTYVLTSLSSMFQFSTAKLAKVYNEERLPTTGAYTVLSLGWTYNDSNNMPALLAVELATGKFYYYHGTEADCNSSAWKEFNFGSGASASDNGIIGDYQSHYGIIDTPYGLPTQGTGNEIKMPAGLKLSVPGADNYITLSSAETYTLTSTTDCTVFYVRGTDGNGATYMEATSVHYSEKEPGDNGVDGFQAWKKPRQNWKFRSVDTGNVWREVVGTPIADCKFIDGNLVRIDFIGYRLLDKQEWLPSIPTRQAGVGQVIVSTGEQDKTPYEHLAFAVLTTQYLWDVSDDKFATTYMIEQRINHYVPQLPNEPNKTFVLKCTTDALGNPTVAWVEETA